MPNFTCTTCGTQFAASDQPPDECHICTDERQFVGWNGQQWTTLDDLRESHRIVVRLEEAGLDIEAAGIEADRRGIRVNEFLQSVSNPVVYAAGDAAASDVPPLTPVANEDGRAVATNLFEGNRTKPDDGPVPTAVFGVPALAAVGLTERESLEQEFSFDVKCHWAKFNRNVHQGLPASVLSPAPASPDACRRSRRAILADHLDEFGPQEHNRAGEIDP